VATLDGLGAVGGRLRPTNKHVLRAEPPHAVRAGLIDAALRAPEGSPS